MDSLDETRIGELDGHLLSIPAYDMALDDLYLEALILSVHVEGQLVR